MRRVKETRVSVLTNGKAAVVPLLLATALALSAAAGCGGEEAIELDGVEVREYQGQDLSSVATDFRENSIKGPQYIDQDSYRMQIFGLVDAPRELSYDEVIDRQLYKKVVELNCVEGWSVNILWEGVLVRDLLEGAGVQEVANTLIFHAADGYTSSLPLDFFYDNDIIIAYRMNEVTIPPERGFPFMLVAEDKWGYKWVKWITAIEVTDDASYEGYWEQRGYSNDAEAGGPKFD
ncbi:MAG: oxidoreductase [Gaiellales bacterium]|nr:MAG: oxidoreductase [Gaiellales bacterium]